MIRNVIILSNLGNPLFHQYFGECYSFGNNEKMIMEFYDTIIMLADQVDSKEEKIYDFGDEIMGFHLDENNIYAIISDTTEDKGNILNKAEKIAKIFTEKYGTEMIETNIDQSLFNDFRNTLIELEITQKNCGDHEECSDCQNNGNELDIGVISKNLKNV